MLVASVQSEPVLQNDQAHPVQAPTLPYSANPESRAFREMVRIIENSRDDGFEPCEDFYSYVCGGFLQSTDIPASRSTYSLATDGVEFDQKGVLIDILEEDYPMLGPFWDSCMDEEALEEAGIKPLALSLAVLQNSNKGWNPMMKALAHLQLMGVDSMWTFEVARDANTDPVRKNLQFTAAGTFLPDQSYYNDKVTQKAYKNHVFNMFSILQGSNVGGGGEGDRMTREDILHEASLAVEFETKLSRWKPKKPSNNPLTEYNPYSFPQLVAMACGKGECISTKMTSHLSHYLLEMEMSLNELINSPRAGDFVLDQPDFFARTLRYIDLAFEQGQGDALVGIPAYLKWSLIHHFAHSLPAFVEENFQFFGKVLAGQRAPKSREELCLAALQKSKSLELILSKYYVERAFDPQAKAAGIAMTEKIEEAFLVEVLPHLSWMDHRTRQQMKTKTLMITNKVGYPNKWPPTDPCYSTVSLAKRHYMRNNIDITRCERKRQLKGLRDVRKVPRGEWDSPSTATNAMYLPDSNTIEIPAAMLQPPYFFNTKFPAAFNFGSAGAAIGHEFTHAFDQQGHMYGPRGKLGEWWPLDVEKQYKERIGCVVDLYEGSVPDPTQPHEQVDGKATLNENLADIGGLRLAFRAFRRFREENRFHANHSFVAGLTPHQLFFVAYGISWCETSTPEYMTKSLRQDEHSPARERVNIPVSQVEAFADAFQCHDTAPMNPKERCSTI